MDPAIRPDNGLLLIALQSAEGTPATLDPTLHAVAFEQDSVSYGSPYTMEQSSEVTGSLVASAPLIIGQAAAISFRSRMKGAGNGTTYSSSVKPPLHAALQGCGLRGLFQAAVAAAALTAGSATSGTLGTGFAATAQLYRGLPLILSGGSAAGKIPLVTDYTSGRVATLSQTFSPVLSTGDQAAIPASWSYAGTSPQDEAARGTDHPLVTIAYYEDGNLKQWMDCRGTVDLEGQSARPGIAAFSFSGTYLGETAAALPSNAVVALHSAPVLVKEGASGPDVALINRKPLPISRWALRNGGGVENPDDPNSPGGFAAGQIVGRTPMFEADPLKTLVTTRDAMAEIAAGSTYPISLRFGSLAGNRWALTIPQAQPVSADPTMRGRLRAESMGFQCLSPGRDSVTRDGDRIITFF